MPRRFYLFLPLALVSALLLFVGGPDYDSLRSFRYGWGVGHLLGFALWSYLYALWRCDRSFERLLLEIVVLSLLIGGLSEIIQSGIGRQASWQDLGSDLVGGLCGVALAPQRAGYLQYWAVKLFRVMVVVLALWSLLPFGRVILDDLIAWRQFPLLSGFETPFEVSRWSGSAARSIERDISFTGRASLKVRLSTHRYSGIGLRDFPQNWTGYRAVGLQVYNPAAEPLTLHFRIHDRFHRQHDNAYSDRFNTSFQLHAGWNQLRVTLADVVAAPKGRPMDLRQVAGLGVFVGKLERPRTIYLDEVKLFP
jgi:hypothetical protein